MNFNITPAVKNIMIINLIVFGLQHLFHGITDLGGLHYFYSDKFTFSQVVTHLFLHDTKSLGHIFGNLLTLFFFGPMLEMVWGAKRFLIFYFLCGFGASFLYSVVNYVELYPLHSAYEEYMTDPNPRLLVNFLNEYASGTSSAIYDYLNEFKENPDNEVMIQQSVELVSNIYHRITSVPLVGASGAIFGILMAFGITFANLEMQFFLIPVPIKAKYVVMLFGVYEFYKIILKNPADNVAHYAHLGGMLFAYILINKWHTSRNDFY